MKKQNYKVLEPTEFNGSLWQDPENWVKRFEIYMKKNDFEEAEYVDCVESYLGGKAKQWYIIYQDKFKDWTKCKELFLKQFKSKERELASWEELQGFKQDSMDILETASKLQVLFKAASITEEKDKLRYLTACLRPTFKKLIFEKGTESWEEAINHLVRHEQLESMCNDTSTGSGGNLFENVTKCQNWFRNI